MGEQDKTTREPSEQALAWMRQASGPQGDLPRPPSHAVDLECVDAGWTRWLHVRGCYKLTPAGRSVTDGI